MHRVTEFAKEKGVTRSRVYQLIRVGVLPAHELPNGVIVLDDAALDWHPRQARPMSPAMAWNLLSMLDGKRPDAIRNAERARVNRHIAAIAAAPNPALELATKVSARARLDISLTHPEHVAALRNDPRVRVSGVSTPGARFQSRDVIEGYVTETDLVALHDAYTFTGQRHGNVHLHVLPHDVLGTTPRIGRAAIAADLAEWRSEPETREANRILEELLWERP